MVKRSRRHLAVVAALALVALAAQAACVSQDSSSSTGCVASSALDCSVAVDGGTAAQGWDLVGYACPGLDRPDQDPAMIEGVPRGLVCSHRGAVADGSGNQGYCCTPTDVECAYNPVAPCPEPEFGYQCRGSSRPEMLNALLSCHQGVFEGDLLTYCCSSPETKVKQGCTQTSAIGCLNGLIGWTCPMESRPTEEELGSNKSKADFYYMVCPIPTPADNVEYNNFCCYVPAPIPVGGSCVEDMAAGCAPGRFGIACYGPDTPSDDFPPMECDPGSPGLSAEGYAATVYCCDFTGG
ncbi:MAG: hypothetical protein JW940_20280 [Polyangiaceae bacterium]|nr:hypothetical protein [Polyangiaceae bacterium]